MSEIAQYVGNTDYRVRDVYFVGTTTLRDNQFLCYQEVAASAVKGLGVDVEVINSDNITYPAGVVAPGEGGRVGPCFVKLLIPAKGDVFLVEVDGTTDVVAGDPLTLDATLGAFIKDASPALADVWTNKALAGQTVAGTGISILVQRQS